jgi:glycosyltransferase involved in cell wall biosynthesis
MRRNICFFNSYKKWGGGEKWTYDMAVRLAGRGHTVVVATNRDSELYARLGGSGVKRLQVGVSNLSFLNPVKILRVCRFLKQDRIDTIVLNLSSDVKLAGVAAKLAGVERVLYARGIAKTVKNTMVNRVLFQKILTGVIANSYATRKVILGSGQHLIPKEKIVVNYLGIDLEQYDKSEPRSVYRRAGNELILGTAGRMVPQKNQKFLIDAAKQLQQRGIEFKLLFAGTGKLSSFLRDYTAASGLTEKIVFLGFVNNIKSFMETIDIFLLSSAWEGFGYVLVEAMASRKPVVSLNSSSEPEIVRHQHSGFIIDASDLDQFVHAILQFEKNRNLIFEFGDRGRKIVEEKFTIERSVQNLERILQAGSDSWRSPKRICGHNRGDNEALNP